MTEKNSDKRIEEALNRAIQESTPDLLDELMGKLEFRSEGSQTLREAVLETKPEEGEASKISSENDTALHATERRDGENGKPHKFKGNRIRIFQAAAAAAAVLILTVGGIFLFREKSEPVAFVGLDVNPSIDISVDDKDRVLTANALNDEGKEILSEVQLNGCEIREACNRVVDAMLADGYLTSVSNSVLLSVRAKDETVGKRIEQDLMKSLGDYLDHSEIAAAVLGQMIGEDEDLDRYAAEHGISSGKAGLIQALLQSGTGKMTEESLLKLSTQELVLLAQERKVENQSVHGKADTSRYLGNEKAEEQALSKAGIQRDQAQNFKIEYDCEDGVLVYEVEFLSGGYKYEYTINAATGEVIEQSKEQIHTDDADDPDPDDKYDDDRDPDLDDDVNDPDRDDLYDDDDDDHNNAAAVYIPENRQTSTEMQGSVNYDDGDEDDDADDDKDDNHDDNDKDDDDDDDD